jgi:hypothetical protein
MEFLRWLLFIPAAAGGGMLGFAGGLLLAVISKLFNRDIGADNPFSLIIIGCSVTYCWFIIGMLTAPKSQDPKRILFALTIIIILLTGIGWAPLVYQFNLGDLLAGKSVSYIWGPIGIIGTTTWIWFSGEARKSLVSIHGTKNRLKHDSTQSN